MTCKKTKGTLVDLAMLPDTSLLDSTAPLRKVLAEGSLTTHAFKGIDLTVAESFVKALAPYRLPETNLISHAAFKLDFTLAEVFAKSLE